MSEKIHTLSVVGIGIESVLDIAEDALERDCHVRARRLTKSEKWWIENGWIPASLTLTNNL